MVSHVWAPIGIEVRQPVQGDHDGMYLALCVDVQHGRCYWEWIGSMHNSEVALGVASWKQAGVEAVVWDNASSHKHQHVLEVGMTLVALPVGAPELNPAERVFEELRKVVKGMTFDCLEEKMLLIENTLRRWTWTPEKVKQLTGWGWIQEAMDKLEPCREAEAAA